MSRKNSKQGIPSVEVEQDVFEQKSLFSLEPNKTILQLKIGKELTQASGPQQKSSSLDADVADNDTSI